MTSLICNAILKLSLFKLCFHFMSSKFYKVRPFCFYIFCHCILCPPSPPSTAAIFADSDLSSLMDPVCICRTLAYRRPIIWPSPFPCWTFFPEEGWYGTLTQERPSLPRVLSLNLRGSLSHLYNSSISMSSESHSFTVLVVFSPCS